MGRIKMIATDGMIYTNGDTYGREIFLGNGDSPDNWWEITEAEYNKITEEAMRYEKDLYQPRTLR